MKVKGSIIVLRTLCYEWGGEVSIPDDTTDEEMGWAIEHALIDEAVKKEPAWTEIEVQEKNVD